MPLTAGIGWVIDRKFCQSLLRIRVTKQNFVGNFVNNFLFYFLIFSVCVVFFSLLSIGNRFLNDNFLTAFCHYLFWCGNLW